MQPYPARSGRLSRSSESCGQGMRVGNLSVFHHLVKLTPGKASANNVLLFFLRLRVKLSKSGGNKDVHGLGEKAVSDVDAGQEFEFRRRPVRSPRAVRRGQAPR